MTYIQDINLKFVASLTRDEEIAILNTLSQDDFLGNGSSRAVYSWDDDLVVKIAVSEPGFNQNYTEIERYKDAVNLGIGKNMLAKIVAYGHGIIIMEKVKVDFANSWTIESAFRSYNSAYDSNSLAIQIFRKALKLIGVDGDSREDIVKYLPEFNRKLREFERYDIMFGQLVEDLDQTYGGTADNEQVGLNAGGELVAYDYGYDTDTDCKQVSHIDSMLDAGMNPICYAIDNCANNNIPTDEDLDIEYGLDGYDNYDDCDSSNDDSNGGEEPIEIPSH